MPTKYYKTRTYTLKSGLKIRFELYHDFTSDQTVNLDTLSPATDVVKISKLNIPFEVVASTGKMRFANFKLKFVDISNTLNDLRLGNTAVGDVFLNIFITEPDIGIEQQKWHGILIKNKTKKTWTRPRTDLYEYEHIEFYFEDRLSDLQDNVYSDMHEHPSGSIYDAFTEIATFLDMTLSMPSTYAVREHLNYPLSSGSNTEGATQNLIHRHIASNKPVLTYCKKWLVMLSQFAYTLDDNIYVIDRVNRQTASIDVNNIMKFEQIETDQIEYIEYKHKFAVSGDTKTNTAYVPTIFYSIGTPSPNPKNNIFIDVTTKDINFGIIDPDDKEPKIFETETWLGIENSSQNDYLAGDFSYPSAVGGGTRVRGIGNATNNFLTSPNLITFETASFDDKTGNSFIEEGMILNLNGPNITDGLTYRHIICPFGGHGGPIENVPLTASDRDNTLVYLPSASLPTASDAEYDPDNSGSQYELSASEYPIGAYHFYISAERTGSGNHRYNADLPLLYSANSGSRIIRRAGKSLEVGYHRKPVMIAQNCVHRLWEYYNGEHIKLTLDKTLWNPSASVVLDDRVYVPTSMQWDFMNYTSEFEAREVSASSHGTADWLGGRPTQSFDSASWVPTGSYYDFHDKRNK